MPFSRIMPSALCCFYTSPQNDQQIQPAPFRSVPYPSQRKLQSYATINVPHAPEMTDVYAFRRLFTQSPACPHADTPIAGNAKHSKPHDSLELKNTFYSGSPVLPPKKLLSIQTLSSHVKQKLSETRLSKSSSRANVNCSGTADKISDTADLLVGDNTSMLGVSVQSTGFSDLLFSRDGSVKFYDSDAESIKTPQPQSPVATIETISFSRRARSSDVALPAASMQSDGFWKKSTSLHEASSSPFLQGPSMTTFLEALELQPIESPDTIVKRLSMCIADGTIKPPTSAEIRTLQIARDEFDRPGACSGSKPPSTQRSLSTPKTIVNQSSDRIGHEKDIHEKIPSPQGDPRVRFEQLSPALLEYLARLSQSQPFSSSTADYATSVILAKEAGKIIHFHDQPDDLHEREKFISAKPLTSQGGPTEPKVQSDEYNSVHLFNMHISQRLASESNAIFASPVASGSTSRRSLNKSNVAASGLDTGDVYAFQRTSGVRAEHNRRPSDPHTKQLFELSDRVCSPYWSQRTVSSPMARIPSSDLDDRSSYHTYDAGPPSSAGNLSAFDGASTSFRNFNSIAIGGRFASYDTSTRHSYEPYRPNQLKQSVLLRSQSTSATSNAGALESATSIIDRCIDGCGEPVQATFKRSPYSRNGHVAVNEDPHSFDNNATPQQLDTDTSSAELVNASCAPVDLQSGWNSDSLRVPYTVTRRRSASSAVAPDAEPLPLTESATDMWNRAYRVACAAHKDRVPSDPVLTEMDDLRRSSSMSAIRLKRQKTILETPRQSERRSQSVGAQNRRAMSEDGRKNGGALSKTLKRLSFIQLRGIKSKNPGNTISRKLQKRSIPTLSKRQSLIIPKLFDSIALNFRNTPPLKEHLGIWGSFPQIDRDKRNGPATERDSVHTQDFAVQEVWTNCSPVTQRRHEPTTEPSSSHNSTKLVFRTKLAHRKKGKSMSFPASAHEGEHRHAASILLDKWRRLHRSSSSEWREYINNNTNNNTISGTSVKKLSEYPDLEPLPGNGLFGRSPGDTSVSPPLGEKTKEAHGTMLLATKERTSDQLDGISSSVSGLYTHSFWKPKSSTSLCDPAI